LRPNRYCYHIDDILSVIEKSMLGADMREIRALLIFLVVHGVVLAEDDELLSDFAEIPLEVDRDYIDDFDDIEALPIPGSKAAVVIADGFIAHDTRDVLRRESSLSILGGSETIASTYYFSIFPQAKFEWRKLYAHLGVPLRFPIYDNVSDSSRGLRRRGFFTGASLITPRPQDFSSFWDAQRIIRHLEIGDAREAHFLRLSRSHAITLGHGELVRSVGPDGLYDQDALFLSGQSQWDYFRVLGFLGPLVKAEMLGLSLRFTPLASLNAPDFVRGLNFDVTYAADFMAPNHVASLGRAFFLADDKRSLKRSQGTAQGAVFGALSEHRPWDWLSLKPYISSGHLWFTGLNASDASQPTSYGTGLHVGHDMSTFFAPNRRSTLILTTEGRVFSHGYIPSYFGSTYLVDRLVFQESHNTSSIPLTKSQYVASLDQSFRFGYLLELSYAYDNMVAAAIGYESAHSFTHGIEITPLRKMFIITSLSGLDLVRLHVGFEASSFAEMKEVFDFDKSRALVSVRGQLKVLPFLYVDSWVKHSFGINDMYTSKNGDAGEASWFSLRPETKSLNFGVGIELAMTF